MRWMASGKVQYQQGRLCLMVLAWAPVSVRRTIAVLEPHALGKRFVVAGKGCKSSHSTYCRHKTVFCLLANGVVDDETASFSEFSSSVLKDSFFLKAFN